MTTHDAALEVRDLTIGYDGTLAVNGVSFDIAPGECLGIVGESGSGKSTISLALMGYLPSNATISSGAIRLAGRDLRDMRGAQRREVLGAGIAMVYQSPMVALNPRVRVGEQVAEAMTVHGLSRDQAQQRVLELFERVRLPHPERAARRYPHQLSGGQLQRVVIAMAISANPSVVIMDEPTTGLDVRTEAAVLELITELRRDLGMAVVLVSHDLGVVSRHADQVLVMRRGECVEKGAAVAVLDAPRHDYTRRLLASIPQVDLPRGGRAGAPPRQSDGSDPVMTARDLTVRFAARDAAGRKQTTTALDGVSLSMLPGEILGVVGESGSGKTTLSRVLAGLQPLDAGDVSFSSAADRRRRVSVVFQDPTSTLNPAKTVGWTLLRTLRLAGVPRADRSRRMLELLDDVRLPRSYARKRPLRLSGGERQRVSIARALAQSPSLMILDEPTSALDVSVQAAVLDLLLRIRDEHALPMVFVTHDLGVVRSVADRVVVFRQGRIIEKRETEALFEHPEHEYVRELLAATRAVHAIH